jgi:hypothetical protein
LPKRDLQDQLWVATSEQQCATPTSTLFQTAPTKIAAVAKLLRVQSAGQINLIFEDINVILMSPALQAAINKINGNIFRGSITLQQAKHNINKNCLKFNDFSNIDRFRSGSPVSVFGLKMLINLSLHNNIEEKLHLSG